MRVPILKKDLPKNFNKVAKYIGRHWPDGPLKFNKAKEVTATLFGYNSMHDLNNSALLIDELPDFIFLNKLTKNIKTRAFFSYNIHPSAIGRVLFKTPFRELSFYKVTDDYRSKKEKDEFCKRGIFVVYDELHLFSSYKSPELVIQHHQRMLIPSYDYAVRKDGYIFSSSEYENFINQFDDFNELFSDDEEDELNIFREKKLLQGAWLPLDSYLSNGEQEGIVRWATPFMISVYHYKDQEGCLGYLIKHDGYDAFYSTLFKTVDEVNKALKCIYLNKEVKSLNNYSSEFDISDSLVSKLNGSEFWRKESVTERKVVIDDQGYFRIRKYEKYPELESNEIAKKLKYITKPSRISPNVIDKDIYAQHSKISQNIDSILGKSILAFDSRNRIASLFESVLAGNKITLEAVYDEGDIKDLEAHEQKSFVEYGKAALKYHSELTPFFDEDAMGSLWVDCMLYIQNSRYCDYSSEWDGRFVAYCFMNSGLRPKNTYPSTEDAVLGSLLISHYTRKGLCIKSLVVSDIKEQVMNLVAMHSRFKQQSRGIKQMEAWYEHSMSLDTLYVSHGPLSTYTEKSMSNNLAQLTRHTRKYNKHS